MKTIYKYRLGVCDHQEITLPKNFETLAVKSIHLVSEQKTSASSPAVVKPPSSFMN